MTTQTIPEAAPKSRPATAAEPTAPASGSERGTPAGYRLLLVALLFGALMPLLWVHAGNLWALPHYQFYPFVILGAGLLAWSRWNDAPNSGSDVVTGIFLVVAAWFALTLGEAVFSPTLAVVALQLLLAAGLFALGGYSFFRALLPAWAFLWILIPLPFGIDRILVNSMQHVASMGSSAVLDLLGVIHVRDGNVIRIAVRPLFVEEACAGISSTVTLVACSLFLVLWLRRPWGRGLLLIVASIGWVLVCNIIRIVAIAAMLDWFGPDYDLSVEPRHSILGFACFSLAVLLIWSTDRFFLFFLPRWNSEPAAVAGESQDGTTAPRGAIRFADLARLAPAPIVAMFGVVLALHFAIHSFILPEPVAPIEFNAKIQKIDQKALRETIKDFRQAQFRPIKRDTGGAYYGENSKAWIYARPQQLLVVSLDYPFPSFHDLAPCYVGQGWHVENARSTHEPKDSELAMVWQELKLHKSGGRNGYVVYAEFNANGDSLEGESRLMGAFHRNMRALTALYDYVFRPAQFEQPIPLGPAYQIQLMIESEAPISPDMRQEAQEIFFTAVRQLHPQIFGPKAK